MPRLDLPAIARPLSRPFSRTKLMAAVLALLQILQEAGVLDLSPETLHKASVAIAAAGLWFLRSALDRVRPASEDPDPGPPNEKLPYEKPKILARGGASKLFGPGGYFGRPSVERRDCAASEAFTFTGL